MCVFVWVWGFGVVEGAEVLVADGNFSDEFWFLLVRN